MKKSYLRYYAKPQASAPLVFFKDAFFAKSKWERFAGLNRQKDYLWLQENLELMPLHERLNTLLWEAKVNWESLDYGYGYFYQSLAKIGVTGFRNTEKRVQLMNLPTRLKELRVLEIGCNSGFLSAEISSAVSSVTAFDVNPYLIKIAEETSRHLGIANTRFKTSSFEDWPTAQKYDAVLSFANHSTHDQNTKQSRGEFFTKCAKLLDVGGILLFESHPPEIEPPFALAESLEHISKHFHIEEQKVNSYGPGLDAGRTFVAARKTP